MVFCLSLQDTNGFEFCEYSSQRCIFYRDVDELIRVISDSNIAISVNEIEALVGAGAGDEDYSQLVEELPHDTGATFMMESYRNRSSVRPCLGSAAPSPSPSTTPSTAPVRGRAIPSADRAA